MTAGSPAAASLTSLNGRVVLVTRPASQAGDLVRLLEQFGAVPLLAPTIELTPAPTGPLDRAIDRLANGDFSWLLVTSRAGADALAARLREKGLAAGDLRVSIAAVGEGTAAALRERGLEPELVPGSFTTSALGEAMPPGTGKVLLARADIAPDGLEAAIASKGWRPVRVDAYRTALATSLPAEAEDALQRGTVDAMTFTSASTVRGFLAVAGIIEGPKVVCIGPVTAQAAIEGGMNVDAVAEPHTIEGLIMALERVLSGAAVGTADS